MAFQDQVGTLQEALNQYESDVFGGLWLDDKLNTRPLFMLGGLLMGVVVAFYGVYRMIQPLLNNKQDKENG